MPFLASRLHRAPDVLGLPNVLGLPSALGRLGLLVLLPATSPAAAQDPASAPDFLGEREARARVLLLGSFHFRDAGLDDYKPRFSLDVLAPERQAEVEELVELIARRFRPTRVAVERLPARQAELDSLYRAWRAGGWELPASELYQIGFRVAARMGLEGVHAADAQPSPRYDEVWERHREAIEAASGADSALDARFTRLYAFDDSLKTTQSLREHLLYVNSPERLRRGHGHYLIGSFKADGGEDARYAGVDLGTRWYNRNLRIFRNLQALTRGPDERILLVIGAGHVPILRHAVDASPEHELVEVADVLGEPGRR